MSERASIDEQSARKRSDGRSDNRPTVCVRCCFRILQHRLLGFGAAARKDSTHFGFEAVRTSKISARSCVEAFPIFYTNK